MADTLSIHQLKTTCRLGVTDQERAQPQPVWIDLELAIDAAKAARRDDVQDAIDYAELVNTVRQAAEGKPYHLLETLAEELAAVVLRRFHSEKVVVRVKKRALLGIDYAAVEIERGR